MKIIANLGKLDEQRTALVIDNKVTPYCIANGYNGETEGDNLWACATGYYSDIFAFAKAITNYGKEGIGWYRMDEIATKAIDKLIENDSYEAEEFLREELDLDDDEVEYFGIGETLDMVKGYEEED